jgi:single-strand DNA-binding protein
MSDGLNRVMLLGNLGADPELRMTSGGQAVLKLRLATSETYLDRNKVKQERTEWHSVVVWGKRGEALAKILNKGSRIFVEGGLRTSTYDDKDGKKRYKTEVVANNIILAGGGRGDEREAAPVGGGGFSDEDYGAKRGGDDDAPF